MVFQGLSGILFYSFYFTILVLMPLTLFFRFILFLYGLSVDALNVVFPFYSFLGKAVMRLFIFD